MNRTDAPNGTRFHHNSDYSGLIEISENEGKGGTIKIPFQDILFFIGSKYLGDKISKIEDLNPEEYLNNLIKKAGD